MRQVSFIFLGIFLSKNWKENVKKVSLLMHVKRPTDANDMRQLDAGAGRGGAVTLERGAKGGWGAVKNALRGCELRLTLQKAGTGLLRRY